MEKNSKILVIVIVLLVIVLGVVGYFLIQGLYTIGGITASP